MDFEVDFAKLGIRWNLGKQFGVALKHLWGGCGARSTGLFGTPRCDFRVDARGYVLRAQKWRIFTILGRDGIRVPKSPVHRDYRANMASGPTHRSKLNGAKAGSGPLSRFCGFVACRCGEALWRWSGWWPSRSCLAPKSEFIRTAYNLLEHTVSPGYIRGTLCARELSAKHLPMRFYQ